MYKSRNVRFLSLLVAFVMVIGIVQTPMFNVFAKQADHVVISEVYGGGGNKGATYQNDFIELYNPTKTDIALDGWQVQYASKSGAFSNMITDLSGTIKAGGYYLIKEAAGTNESEGLPVHDAEGNIAMGGSDGKVRLVDANGTVIDFVGYGAANDSETDPIKGLSATASAQRKDNDGAQNGETNGYDTDNNSTDFYTGEPNPRNSTYVVDGGETPDESGIVSISTARTMEIGSTVKVRGIVTFKEASGSSFNYVLQDGTAGIALRGTDGLEIGDEVIVEGKTSEYNGLLQVAYTLIEKVSENKALPEPKEVTIGDIIDNNGGENYESQRVKISGVKIGAINTGGNTTITDQEGKTTNIYKIPALSAVAEGDWVDVIAVCSQFNSYQLRVVSEDDVAKGDEPTPPAPEEDTVGPTVSALKPGSGSSVGENRRPEISATFEDESGVDMTSVKMIIDGEEVSTEKLIKEDNTVKYTVESDLAHGKHTVVVEVKDMLGNEATKEWSFTVGKQEYDLYFGQLHSHTTNSDGTGTLDDAYSYAKDKANVDFLAVTDHSNSFDNDTTESLGNGTTSTKWKNGLNAAEKYTDEDFLGIYAYEMTWSNGTGHINTFNTPGFESRNKSEYKAADGLKTYYERLKEFPYSFSQFNHPGTTFGDFNDFGYYDAAIDEIVTLIEVGNGEGAIRGSGYYPSYEYYTRALDKGWHVAPSNNQDNHKGKWGNANTARTVVLADGLSQDGIYDALTNRRVYSSEDENLRINYTLNGEVMGTILADKPSEVNIKVEIEDPDNEAIGKVSVITEGGKVVASKTVTTSKEAVEFNIAPDNSYYYIRIDQADKDIAVTAPVWVGDVDKVGISKTEADTTMPIKGEEFTIQTDLFNNEASVFTVNSIEYSIDGQVIHSTNEEFTINTSGTKSYSFKYTPTKSGKYNVNVKVTGTVNGVERIFNDVLSITVADPDAISRVVVDSTHFNDYVGGYYANNMGNFIKIANANGVAVKIETEKITDELLSNAEILVITAPAKKSGTANGVSYEAQSFSDEFIATVKKYVDNGGNIIVSGLADYQDGTGEYASSTQLNKLLKAIGATSRINNDEVVDDDNKVNNQSFRLAFNNYNMNSAILNGVVDGQTYSFYSGCSVNIDKEAYEAGKVDWLVKGHDTTYSFDSNSNTTGSSVPKGEVIALAEETLSGGGKMYIGGTVFMSDFEVQASLDNAGSLQNSNYNIVLNMLTNAKKEEAITPIIDVVNAEEGARFVVEGIATSGTISGNAFFDTIYIQDETAGINLFPISGTEIIPGQKLRVVGTVSSYEGERQLNVSSFEVIDANINQVEPTEMTTEEVVNPDNVGTLVKVKGTITDVKIENGVVQAIMVKDESGVEARVFINGYIGYSDENSAKIEDIAKVGNTITTIGLASIDPEGSRIRVRDKSEIELATENIELTIFHTNDSHGRVKGDSSIIGIDTISAIKKSVENSLLVDAGDTLHGLPFATMNKGADIVELMKIAGYDLMAPGNHDFNYGYERLLELATLASQGESGFEIISANVLKEKGLIFKSMASILNSNSIKEVNGIKVGFFGLTSPETTYKTNPNNVVGLEFADPIQIAEEQVKALKKAGADVVIALAHIGIDESTEVKSTDIAREVEGIDVIIDGHSHSKLENGLQAANNTLIVSAGEYEGYLGELTISIDPETKSVVNKSGTLINKATASEVVPDEVVTAKINEISTAQDIILSKVIGQTATDLDGERANVRTGETNLGNLVTDAMLNTSGAEIAITNGGGIRATIKAGNITKGNVIEVLPFGNFIVTKYLTGSQIKDVIEHGVKDAPNAAGQFPHVAGINYVYDPEQSAASRIVKITLNGEELDMNKQYLVATNDFISAGGDGYPHFANIKTENEFAALDEALADYVQKLGTVDYKVEGRITIGTLTGETDKDAAQGVIDKVIQLPEIEDIALGDADKVRAVRGAYDALTDEQKALVPQEVLDKLLAAEAKIVELEQNPFKAYMPNVDNVEGKDGMEIKVPMIVNAFPSDKVIKAAEMIFELPVDIELKDIELNNKSIKVENWDYNNVDGTVRVALANMDGTPIFVNTTSGDKNVVTLTLALKGDKAEGDVTAVKMPTMVLRCDNDVDVEYDTTEAVSNISFVAKEVVQAFPRELYTSAGEIVPEGHKAYAIEFTGVNISANIKSNQGLELHYSQEFTIRNGKLTYVVLVAADTEISELANVSNYTIDSNTIESSITFGDVNGDGIDAQDALSAVSAWLRKDTLSNKGILTTNVSGDGSINTRDAIDIVDNYIEGKEFKILAK